MTTSAVRIRDWQERLDAVIEARRETPFAWRGNDCWQFSSAVVDALIGSTALADALPPYANRREAIAALRTLGDGLRACVTQVLGEPVGRDLAAQGDIGLFKADGPAALVVCNGSTWIGVGRQGLELADPAGVVCAWKVG